MLVLVDSIATMVVVVLVSSGIVLVYCAMLLCPMLYFHCHATIAMLSLLCFYCYLLLLLTTL